MPSLNNYECPLKLEDVTINKCRPILYFGYYILVTTGQTFIN